ncbi:zinc finger protein [Cinnamomum micranthum f. kanehirae]|uniref:Zinc finger protein n=1 Tax=Cinnamomum micranthum f. kanehirae TaxID=337451 RepID=A0A443PWP5_9MAGN|nr:zinc finger protein [Cinnamomum micranthum f. kanehirae]
MMSSVECTGCHQHHRPHLLHNLRHRGSFHRICTSCVLKSHPGSFCPCCLDLFDGPPPSDLIKCSKCPATAHPACVRPETAATPAPVSYVCPSCSNPSFSFFDASRRSESKRAIDLKSAKALLAAARIATVSMNRAANLARLEAEKKVKEAAVARKRAREALENVAAVACREKKEKGKEAKERTPKKAVAAEEKDKLTGSPSSVLGRHHLQNHVVDEEKEKTPAFSRPSAVTGQQQQSQNSSFLLKEEEGEEGKPNGFAESDSGPHEPSLPKPNQDASVSMANPGVVLMGLQDAGSLIL